MTNLTKVTLTAGVPGDSGDVSTIDALIAVAATQTTLAAVLAKLIAAPSTEAKQDDTITAIEAAAITAGTAGAASTEVVTVQGIASMTPLFVRPQFTSIGVVTLQSNATGSTYNTFASQACSQLNLVNDTGADLEVQLGGAGSTFILWNGASVTLPGLTNASNVGYRRKDQSNTQVTLAAFWNS